jgi:hypothetical protein
MVSSCQPHQQMQEMLQNSPAMPSYISDWRRRARYKVSRKPHAEKWKHLRKAKKSDMRKQQLAGLLNLMKN